MLPGTKPPYLELVLLVPSTSRYRGFTVVTNAYICLIHSIGRLLEPYGMKIMAAYVHVYFSCILLCVVAFHGTFDFQLQVHDSVTYS
jgi:hypothetical protein